MRGRTIVILMAAAAVLASIWVAGSVVAGPSAQGPEPQAEVKPQGDLGILAALGAAFYYQGYIERGGQPVNGTCDFRFRLYDAAEGGTQVGDTLARLQVDVIDGVFTVQLNFGEAAFSGESRWLATRVRCPAGTGDYTELTPRQQLLAVPYALSLRPGARIVGSVDERAVLYAKNESAADDSKALSGRATAESGDTYGVYGQSLSSSGKGVYGYASATSGQTDGVLGKNDSTEGRGVVGWATADTGPTIGVYGRSDSDEGKAVYGKARATSGPTYGVYGESSSAVGTGVYGKGYYGLYGESDATSGTAVYGKATATSGPSHGVYGLSASTIGTGVLGWNTANSGRNFGVWGSAESSQGFGGYFDNDNGVALYAGSIHGNLIEAWFEGGLGDRRFYVSNDGEVYADGSFNPGGADLAEMLPATKGLEPGDVLIIGSDGKLALSTIPNAANVAGVYSTKPGFVGGSDEDGANPGKVPLAVVGIVPVKASAENGAIKPGDLLTSSSTPGHAMKAGRNPSIGTIIGKALEGLSEGTGVIKILVMLQ